MYSVTYVNIIQILMFDVRATLGLLPLFMISVRCSDGLARLSASSSPPVCAPNLTQWLDTVVVKNGVKRTMNISRGLVYNTTHTQGYHRHCKSKNRPSRFAECGQRVWKKVIHSSPPKETVAAPCMVRRWKNSW
jgi:hypothetical protein